MESLRLHSSVAPLTAYGSKSVKPGTCVLPRSSRPNPPKLLRSSPSRQHYTRVNVAAAQASSLNTEVQTGNDFKFTHSYSENTFEVRGDIDKIFEYAADFSHIDQWDAGNLRSKLTACLFPIVHTGWF